MSKMTNASPLDDLTNARTWGLISDLHGNAEYAIDAAQQLTTAGAKVLVQLGDFGLVWNGLSHELRQRARLDETLRILDRKLYVIRGNHENFDLIESIEPEAGGLRWIGSNIAFLPRAGRLTTTGGTRIGWLGGANSIDKDSRDRHSWWEQERITEADLEALGTDRLDILLGHDAPKTGALRLALDGGLSQWTRSAHEYAEAGQAMFSRGFAATAPKLVVGGHYHLFLDSTEAFLGEDGTVFESRVVVLDMERSPKSAALLDAETLKLTPMDVPLRRRWPLGESGTELAELRRRTGLAPDAAAAKLGLAASSMELFLAGRLTPADWILDQMRQWPELDEE